MTAVLDAVETTPGDTVASTTMFGLAMDPLRMDEVVDLARTAVTGDRRLLVGVLNAAKIVHARRDVVLRDSLLQADIVLADGQAVVWASRILGRPLPERVTGIDLFEHLLTLADEQGYSVYLLGATPEVLHKVVDRIRAEHPRVRIAGARDGYFAATEQEDVAAEIRGSGADMLFLGMSSPKKENFLAAHCDSLGVPVLHGVGGSFDILAGLTRRAPLRWQRLGVEWLYRLVQEPRRMWRRYLTTNTAFILMTLRELVVPTSPYRNGRPRPTPVVRTRVSDIARDSLARAGVREESVPGVHEALDDLSSVLPVRAAGTA